MVKKKLTGNTKVLSDDWEETIRQIRTQTAVDFTMTGEEKARKLRQLEANSYSTGMPSMSSPNSRRKPSTGSSDILTATGMKC